MKKLIVFAVLALIATTSAQAQFLRFGLKAGPNFASFNGGVSGIDYSGRTSFHAGAVVQIKPVGGNFAIQPEVLYSSQGADVEGYEDFNLDYISVPVMVKFYILSDLLSLEVGPQFSFLVDDSAKVADDIFGASEPETKSFDFAAAGGLGLNITKNLFAQARYTIGLTEVSKDAEVKNAVFQVSVGYMF